MSEIIEVCPECDQSGIAVSLPDDTPKYRCKRCNARFDEPNRRESRGHGQATSPHAKSLIDADPDDINIQTDGGVHDVAPETTVYVATTQRGARNNVVYHTDPDCARLQSSNNIHEKERGVLADSKTQCKFCAGVAEKPSYNADFNRALKNADPDDILTDGGVTSESPSNPDGVQTVWVPQNRHGGSYSVYHTDRDCHRLKQAEQTREKTLETISPRLRECKVCAGEVAEKTQSDTRVCDLLENLSTTGVDLTEVSDDG